jgi:hypothetical protein
METRTRPAWAEREDATDYTRVAERLVPVIRAFAQHVEPRSVTLRQLLGVSRTHQILVGQKSPAQMKCLRAAMQAAGLTHIRGTQYPQRFRLTTSLEALHVP